MCARLTCPTSVLICLIVSPESFAASRSNTEGRICWKQIACSDSSDKGAEQNKIPVGEEDISGHRMAPSLRNAGMGHAVVG
jgi:hypothetical protein